MILLVLALAYIVGVWIGSGLMGAGRLGCGLPDWLWMVPLALLPLIPLLNGKPEVDDEPMRWPESAGFVRPQVGIQRGLVMAALLCVLMGGLRLASVPQAGCWTPAYLAAWNLSSDAAFDREAPQTTVVGYISNFPTVDDEQQEVVVTVSRLNGGDGWRAVQGQARLVTAARPRFRYGQPVEVTGRLATPPDFADFSYREVLARRGIYSHFYGAQVVAQGEVMQGAAWRRWLYDVRSRAMLLIERMLPEPHGALAEGILLGVDAGIPDALYDRFNATGTSHVLVISGSNVALIVALLLGVSRRLVGRWAVGVAVVGIVAYTVLVGAGMGRRSTALISLAAACWLMLLVNPQTLYDVGFQLSAIATLGLILFASSLMEWLSARWPVLQGGPLTGGTGAESSVGALLRGVVVDGGVMTVAASVLTLPLMFLVTSANRQESLCREPFGCPLLTLAVAFYGLSFLIEPTGHLADAGYFTYPILNFIRTVLGVGFMIDYNLRRKGKRFLATHFFVNQWRFHLRPRSTIERHFAWAKRYFGLEAARWAGLVAAYQHTALVYSTMLVVAILAHRFQRPELATSPTRVLARKTIH